MLPRGHGAYTTATSVSDTAEGQAGVAPKNRAASRARGVAHATRPTIADGAQVAGPTSRPRSTATPIRPTAQAGEAPAVDVVVVAGQGGQEHPEDRGTVATSSPERSWAAVARRRTAGTTGPPARRPCRRAAASTRGARGAAGPGAWPAGSSTRAPMAVAGLDDVPPDGVPGPPP